VHWVHGAEADRHKRLRDLAEKRDAEAKASIDQRAADAANAKSGDDLVQIGYAYATMGQADKGVPLIEQGIAKGGLKRPDDARLRLGMALMQSAARTRPRRCRRCAVCREPMARPILAARGQ
jgi:hypothetical protein